MVGMTTRPILGFIFTYCRRIESIWPNDQGHSTLCEFRLTVPSLGDTILSLYEKGPVAQLGARLNRTEEAMGSNPLRSTLKPPDVGVFI
jgi:hypothetical protein